jgi:hypothetical protein
LISTRYHSNETKQIRIGLQKKKKLNKYCAHRFFNPRPTRKEKEKTRVSRRGRWHRGRQPFPRKACLRSREGNLGLANPNRALQTTQSGLIGTCSAPNRRQVVVPPGTFEMRWLPGLWSRTGWRAGQFPANQLSVLPRVVPSLLHRIRYSYPTLVRVLQAKEEKSMW